MEKVDMRPDPTRPSTDDGVGKRRNTRPMKAGYEESEEGRGEKSSDHRKKRVKGRSIIIPSGLLCTLELRSCSLEHVPRAFAEF